MLDIVDLMDIIVEKSVSLIVRVYKACKMLLIRHLTHYKKEREKKKEINSKYSRFRVKILDEKAFNKIKSKGQVRSTNSDLVIYKGLFVKRNRKRNNNKEDKN